MVDSHDIREHTHLQKPSDQHDTQTTLYYNSPYEIISLSMRSSTHHKHKVEYLDEHDDIEWRVVELVSI